MFVCKKQSTSYFYCRTENSSTSPTAEHPPPEIMETQKCSSPVRGILPCLCPGVTAQVCVHRAQSQSRGWHSVPRAQQPPQHGGCRLRVPCHPLQGSSSCLSHWCIFTLQHLSSSQWFDEMWGEERASKHLCGRISCICNKFLGT